MERVFTRGGALSLHQTSATIARSTIEGNRAWYSGGISSSGGLNISDTTISFNIGKNGGGGGIDAFGSNLINSTITNNDGGGIQASMFDIGNSIIDSQD